ncbi:Glutathione S-transferase [Oryctes borbonicus]|uniref:Glutathione S-transferase n=1 Tax=Oryctes borbonicus TaxID=1629725 RepID=A0A0T6B3B1_9SCAR|nr:Glutathione S-transferase [Oryctes borbonicus]
MQNDTVIPIFTANKSAPNAEEMNGGDEEEGTIDFYYFPPSPPCRSVMMLAKTLGLDMNMKTVNIMAGEQMEPEYLKMNPQHSIPTLDDKGFVLWESRAILQYLADRYAKDDTLNPKEAKRAALVNQRLYFDACTLFPRLYEYFYPIIFQKQPPNPEKAEKAEEALDLLNGYLENQIWVAGSYMTVADFALAATVATAQLVQFDLSKYPNIESWYKRAKKTMADFEEINEKGGEILANMFKKNIEQ